MSNIKSIKKITQFCAGFHHFRNNLENLGQGRVVVYNNRNDVIRRRILTFIKVIACIVALALTAFETLTFIMFDLENVC